MMPRLLILLCVVLSACSFGRRGRNLDRAVEHTYYCAAAEGYRYEDLGPNRYRVRACFDRSVQRYRHRAVFHCSAQRCISLTERAAKYFAAASHCPIEKVEVREAAEPTLFDVAGCEAQASLRCEMRDNEVACMPALQLSTPPSTSGGEVAQPPVAAP